MSAFTVPLRVAFVVADSGDPQVFLMHLPDGPPLVLKGAAAVIWVLAADGEDDVVGAVSEVVGRPRGEVADEVRDYLRDLVRKGFLVSAE